jgi:cobalamin biosynthesis Mg chelatase CobN
VNEDPREYDMMACTDYYNYYGGLIVAGKTVTGKLPFYLTGDSSDPKRVKMRTVSIDKLLEAISRGMWQADAQMEEALKEEYLEVEGEIKGITE